jgi:hypothetical protein
MEQIQFFLMGIKLDKFEVNVKRPETAVNFELQYSINFGYDVSNKMIQCRFDCFYNSKEQPWLTFVFDGFFGIQDESWLSMLNDKDELLIPKNLAAHLAAIIVSSARGALFVCCQNTAYADEFLPLLNVSELFPEDLHLKPNLESSN